MARPQDESSSNPFQQSSARDDLRDQALSNRSKFMSNVVIALFSSAGYDRAAQGVAGAGRRLADQLGGKLHAIVIGAQNAALNTALASVADAVVSADQAELSEYQPEA